MTKAVRRTLLVAGLTLATPACALHFTAETLGVKATVAQPPGDNPTGADFEVSKKAIFMLWGVLPVARPSLDRALAGQLIDGSEVANLQVHVRSRFSDLFVTAITLGLIVPRTVTFSGTVINNQPPR